MSDNSLIDVESLDFSDDQTLLYKVPEDSGQKVDMLDFNLSCDYPLSDEETYAETEAAFYAYLDDMISKEINKDDLADRHKFDSRTFVKPKRRLVRPSMVDIVNMAPRPSNPMPSKYLTYNKYNSPLGQVSPMLRLKTFNVDTNTDNSQAVKEYAKRRSLVQDDDPQLADMESSLVDDSCRLSDASATKPIDIDLSQPVHHIHSSFKSIPALSERPSLSMYGSGESLMRMSPPSLVTSLQMDTSGTYGVFASVGAMVASQERGKCHGRKGNGLTTSCRDSVDPLLTSMTLSILDEREMSTSLLSQTTGDRSLIDSQPPSLVSSVNSSYIVNKPETNVFSSATFTHLSPSDKLLTARPRHQMFNSRPKVESEAKMTDTVTLFTNQYREAEKENCEFETDDAFYKDMGIEAPGRETLNVTLDKRELNEIIQARQKLSMARKALPADDNASPNKTTTIHLPNQTITVPKQSIENASELLARRRQNGDKEREPPRRSLTFKTSPKVSSDTTVVYVKEDEGKMIDINSATMNLIDSTEKPSGETFSRQPAAAADWSQRGTMSGSADSADTGTFSSSSPPETGSDPRLADPPHHQHQISSTPQTAIRQSSRNDFLNIMTTISPIYDLVDDKSYTITRAHDATVINSATIVRKSNVKRDILADGAAKKSPSKLSPPSAGTMGPPSVLPKKSGLPSSKLRQYSSHRELNRIPAAPSARAARGGMSRRPAYASNPALSPPAAPAAPAHPLTHAAHPVGHSDSYTVQQPREQPPPLVRQGTETLRRERPHSLVAPKDYRAATTPAGPTARVCALPASSTRPAAPAPRAARPSSVPSRKLNTAPMSQPSATGDQRPATGDLRQASDTRLSGLPRPSRLPAPKRSLRPPSVYSAAPADYNQY